MKRTLILAIAAALAISPASANSVKIERVPAARSLKPAKRALPEQMVTATNVTAALSNPVTDLARAVIIYRALAAEYDPAPDSSYKSKEDIDRAASERAIANFILDACQRLDRPRMEQLAAKVKLDDACRKCIAAHEKMLIVEAVGAARGRDNMRDLQKAVRNYDRARANREALWTSLGVNFRPYYKYAP